MKSGWLIEYKDGKKIVASEEVFKIHEGGFHGNKSEVKCYDHYFDIEKAIANNPGVPLILEKDESNDHPAIAEIKKIQRKGRYLPNGLEKDVGDFHE